MQNRRGFTLLELMIVIAIIIVLASVLIAAFSGVFGRRDAALAQTNLETFTADLSSYQAKWHAYPPSTIAALSAMARTGQAVSDPNDINVGIETLVMALRSRKNGGPYLTSEMFNNDDFRKNLDSDELIQNVLDVEGSLECFEMIDPWGNPYVYVNINDMRNGNIKDNIKLEDGTTVELNVMELQEKLKHPTTGQYPKGYAIWSFGPDKKNDYGRGDDITSWPKYSE